MRLLELRLVNYRNLETTVIHSDGRDLFLLGHNGQGKSNILEAIGLMTALRSFRTSDLRSIPAWQGDGSCGVWARISHEVEQECVLEMRFKSGERVVSLDGVELSGWRNFLGRFPTIPFCSQDLQLLRGAPALRRRFMDGLIAGVMPGYFDTLRRYHGALRERNRLLKDEAGETLLVAFEKVLAPLAAELVETRAAVFAQMDPAFRDAYAGLTGVNEEPCLIYQPDCNARSEEDWLELYSKNRPRERMLGTTRNGPHRDDFDLSLLGKSGQDFASDGQQRSLVLALRMAQALWTSTHNGIAPVILADDILGELDPERRRHFWNYLPECWQICASGTAPLPGNGGRNWQVWQVKQGQVTAL